MNEYQRKQKEAVEIKRNYPAGTRIELNEMIDTYSPVKAGMRGTVRFVDSMGQIHMQWDDGRTLALIPDVDSFRKLTDEEIEAELRMEQSTINSQEL